MKKNIFCTLFFSIAIICTLLSSNNLRSYVNTIDLLSGEVEALSDSNNPDPGSIYEVPDRLPNPDFCIMLKVISLQTGATVNVFSGEDVDSASLAAAFGMNYFVAKVEGAHNKCNGPKKDGAHCYIYSCHTVTNSNY